LATMGGVLMMVIISVYRSVEHLGGPVVNVGRATEALTLQRPLVVASLSILAPDHAVGISHHDGGCGSRSPPGPWISILVVV